MQLGKMYCMKQHFWLLFPTKETAIKLSRSGLRSAATYQDAKWLSEHYNCNVSFVEPNTCVVLLEVDEDERCYKLLDSNGNIGWIYCCDDFSKYFDPVKE